MSDNYKNQLLTRCINIAEEQRKLDLMQKDLNKRKEELANELKDLLPNLNDKIKSKIGDHYVEVHHGGCWDCNRQAFNIDVSLNNKRTGFLWIFSSEEKQ